MLLIILTRLIIECYDFRVKFPAHIFLCLLILLPFTYTVAQPSADSIPQKDIVDVLIKTFNIHSEKKHRDDKKVRLSIIPVAPSSSGGKQMAVSSVNATFYLGDLENTNLSNIYFIPFFNFSGTGGFLIRPNLWTNENLWNITGEIRIAKNYLDTYGLGANTQEEAKSIVKYGQYRLYSVFHRKVAWYFYAGAGLDVNYYTNIEEENPGAEDSAFKEYGIGTSGNSVSSGLTINLLRDSRKNSVNPEGGFYTTLIVRLHGQNVGSETNWQSVYLDGRKYFSFSQQRHKVLGFWFLYWGTYGDVPYLNLPGTGMDNTGRSGRGYPLGRYRGKQMLYGEAEYRFDITANGMWGGVVFTNVQSYTEYETDKFQYIKPAIGTGIRLKFDKRSNTNLTLDFAVGKDSYNIRVNLGEFF